MCNEGVRLYIGSHKDPLEPFLHWNHWTEYWKSYKRIDGQKGLRRVSNMD